MNMYKEELTKMGIAESRTQDLADAMNMLASAICKLDLHNLRIFSQKFGILGHLDLFCRVENTRNVAQEMYEIVLKSAAKQIDFEEFREFSDRLFHLAEQANEVKIPGAQMLCRSLCDLRKNYEAGNPDKDTVFVRLAKKYELNEVEYRLSEDCLEIRNTNQYTGSCRHMDDWTTVGTCTVLARETRETADASDYGTDLMFIKVRSDRPVEDVKHAIKDTFSWHGCSCEHDCCGCLSQSARKMKHLFRNIWVVELSWSRNV